MSQQPNISKGTRLFVKGSNARFGRVVESHTTQVNTQLVLMDGSPNPTVLAASSLGITEDGAGCSPGTRAARAVANGGRGAAALEYLDEDEEAEDPPPPPKIATAKAAPAKTRSQHPRTAVTNTMPSDKSVWRALGRWWELKSRFVCYLSPTRSRANTIHLTSLNLLAHIGFVGREHGDLGGGGPLER
jgi:hypothetical protein